MCILYEGVTLTDAVCLEVPKAQGVPALGTESAAETEADEKHPKTPGAGSRLMDKFRRKIAGMFTGGTEDESGLLDE